jgi:hypothetical protein
MAPLPAGEELEVGQAEHVLVPTVYDPAAHIVHVPPLAPVYPALQTQAVPTELPVAVVVLAAGQAVQAALPVSVLYVPTAQDVQVPPLGPVEPALQTQAVITELAMAVVVLAAGQAWQSAYHEAEPD